MKEKSETIQLRISPDLKKKLKDVSALSGVSMSKIIEQAIESSLSDNPKHNFQDELIDIKNQLDMIHKIVTS